VDSTTTVKSDQLNVAALTGKNMKIAHDASTPQILIYHTRLIYPENIRLLSVLLLWAVQL